MINGMGQKEVTILIEDLSIWMVLTIDYLVINSTLCMYLN